MKNSYFSTSTKKQDDNKYLKCKKRVKITLFENEFWYIPIFFVIIGTFIGSIFLIYDINYIPYETSFIQNYLFVDTKSIEFLNVVLFSALGGTTASRM
jgi:ABC-type spermidine/putrescine transport system permease subunit I